MPNMTETPPAFAVRRLSCKKLSKPIKKEPQSPEILNAGCDRIRTIHTECQRRPCAPLRRPRPPALLARPHFLRGCMHLLKKYRNDVRRLPYHVFNSPIARQPNLVIQY